MMSRLLDARRRLIGRRGRPMTLRRMTPGGNVDVVLRGFNYVFTPERITGGVQQGDTQLAILADEIQAAGWPAPPRNKDSVVIDGSTWSVQGATPLYDGTTLVGFNLWLRGGR